MSKHRLETINGMPDVCGIDEAGRGALAGPLVAASVSLRIPAKNIEALVGIPLRDSKILTKNQRVRFYNTFLELPVDWNTRFINVPTINSKGIQWSNIQAIKQLIRIHRAQSYIVDGNFRISVFGKNVQSVPHADATIPEVICAGIIAKVTRDMYMEQLSQSFPQFAWDKNAGYGTKFHIHTIRSTGTTCHHRTVFVQTACTPKKKNKKSLHRNKYVCRRNYKRHGVLIDNSGI